MEEKVSKKYAAEYYRNGACFRRRGLKKRIVLHELYHHLVEVNGWNMPFRIEEKDANRYAGEFLKSRYS